jgi:poly(A)-specific ribonuclease
MEVTQSSFYGSLMSILLDIAEAEFVTIDFEFSGIARNQFKPFNSGGRSKGRPPVQERYKETKDAASRYQILQFGLTAAKRDLQTGKWAFKAKYELSLGRCFHTLYL